ncbi:UDP-N-acetylmuramoylalanyl-D-glutamate--2,6-diaminopimelate ligase [Actinomyces sp. HMSC064C12]|nr:UDP-N-acetylmuramoylalanyl-D-glutamate--2,6-diaminopimelate ligase [Actinomyces sp. HMSC064C12]
MEQICDIRPRVVPVCLSDALAGLDYEGPGGVDQVRVCGVSVSTHDIDKGWIFVAVKGYSEHGIDHARVAVRHGAVVVVTDREGAVRAGQSLGVPVVVVEDTRQAAARISCNVYSYPARDLVTATVTGTNGKTTTTYLLRALLGIDHPRAALCGTNEISVGRHKIIASRTTAEAPVLQRILASAREQDLGGAVVETSSHALSLHRVDGICFDVALFTNLQHDHLDYYGDMETYFAAKAALFTPAHSKAGVICVDDQWGKRLSEVSSVPSVTVAALSDSKADWWVSDIGADKESMRTVFTLHGPAGQIGRVACPVLGEVNVQNCALSVVAGVQLGYKLEDAIGAIEGAGQVPGRMQKVNPSPHAGQPLVIADYAHTPEGLDWTLKSVRDMTYGKVVIVFGTDGDRDPSKREDLAEVAARRADILWVTDENPRTEDPQKIRDYLIRGIKRVRPNLENVTEITTCRRDAVRKAILSATEGDIVMLTGKGIEWYQDIENIKHTYSDIDTAAEILQRDPRREEK